MYGQGNIGPQFGQGLQRPMPPYQQRPAGSGHLPALLGQPFPMQQGGQHRGVPPRGLGYLPGSPNMAPHAPLGSVSNVGQSFLQRPLGYGGTPTQPPYLAGQPNFSSGTQNSHPVGPPPTFHYVGPRVLPQPPLQHPAGFGPPGPQSTLNTQQSVHHMPLPPPPPPPPLPQTPFGFYRPANFVSSTQQPSAVSQIPPLSSASVPMAHLPPLSFAPINVKTESLVDFVGSTVPSEMHESESAVEQKSDGHDGDGTSVSHKDLSLKQSGLLELPLPPPPKPKDDKVVRNIEVLCQYIAKNGPEFEERVRKNESGNPDFCFLVGGDPGSAASCAQEYYLWFKKKCGLLNNIDKGLEQKDLSERHASYEASAEPSSFSNVATAHSSADSDVDMEDDITQSDKEPGIYNLGEDLSSDPVSAGKVSEMQTQENTLQHPKDSDAALQLGSPIKSETLPLDSVDRPPGVDSPFRLIRNYASDDHSENDDEAELGKGTTVQVSPSHESEFATSREDIGCGEMNPKCGMAFEAKLPQLVTACVDSLLIVHDSEAVQTESRSRLSDDSFPEIRDIDDRYRGAEPSNLSASFQGEYASGSGGNVHTVSCEVGRENKKSTTATPTVDEFGRLVKECVSDSESDGSHHMRQRGRRDQSRSHSRSPSDRRRRSPRKGLRRRKDRRSRSRSWSPKRRRSRSRSPYRSGDDSKGGKLGRAIGQTPQCLEFVKGRCKWGASCRFLHHDVDKNESSSSSKVRQHQAEVASATKSGFGGNEYHDMKGETNSFHQDGSISVSKINKNNAKSKTDAVSIVEHKDVEKLAIVECEDYRNENRVQGASEEPISLHFSTSVMTPTNHPLNQNIISESQRRDEENTQAVLGSSETGTSAMHTSMFPPRTYITEPCEERTSIESTGPCTSTVNLSPQVSQLPPSPLASVAENAQQELKGQLDHNPIPHSVSFPIQHVPVQSVTGYRGPGSTQQSHFPVPPNSAWGILPITQPRPPTMVHTSISGAPLQFPQGSIALRYDFSSQTTSKAEPGEFRDPQVGGFQYQAYQLPSRNVLGQAYNVPSLSRDDRSSQFSFHGHTPSGHFAPGLPSQPVPFLGDTAVKSMTSYPGSNMLVVESSNSTLYNQHTQIRFPHDLSLTATDSMPSHLGGSPPVPGYAAESVDNDQPSHSLDVGRSRISTHYNPYASTFDQPLNSRFCSTVFTQDGGGTTVGTKYDGSFSLSSTLMGGQTAGAYESRQITSSPSSSRARGHTLGKSGGDQYDPLFDSIETSKRAQKMDLVAGNSEMLKASSHHKMLDVAENNKQKEIGAVVATLVENDEYGETADVEVGVVENGSSSDPDEDAVVAKGEIESEQVKSDGNGKKSKDSRSMKLFKVAVANFVKDVLKPQWRQGNMSKEVFKTIVKKTVDKVSGAMKNHRLPKSQAKIDHYIDSSRRKLTQLVKGYVSKYKI